MSKKDESNSNGPAPGQQLISAYREEAALYLKRAIQANERGYEQIAQRYARAAQRLERRADQMDFAQLIANHKGS